ncbi:MAG: lysylphosphatidylglycerol synthase transmembrane domain-containing protein [Syntrophomonas sp.]
MNGNHRKDYWKTILRAIVSAGLLGWLAMSIDWLELGRVLSKASITWLLVAVIGIIFSMIVSVSKWQQVLQAQDIQLSWKKLWQAYWAGLFFNNFLPSSIGGDALRIIWISKATRDVAGATASVVAERILATTGLAITGMIGAFFISQPDLRIIAMLLVLLAISLGLLGLLMVGRLPVGTVSKQGAIISFLRGLTKHGNYMRHYKRRIIRVLALSVVFQVTVVGINYFIFLALGISDIGWQDALYIIPVTSVAAMVPVGINGYGVRESAYVFLLGSWGVARGSAFAASLLFAFLVSLCSLYGGLIWLKHRNEGEYEHAGIRSIADSQ